MFGPRGTGKSSWVTTRFPDALYFDLLESEIYNQLLASPQRLDQMIPEGFNDWVILDEVQKIPRILDEVHRLIEKRKLKFILTGSSARKLKHKGVNLLAGRALSLAMNPLTAVELGKDFDIRKSLRFGHLPSAWVEAEPKRYLESYVKTYLREEIQQEGLTRNLGAFSRFLEAASFSQASVLNIATVARDCSVERKTVENYFQVLEDLLLCHFLPVFTKRAKRRMQSHPKFYFFDTGVYRTLRPKGPLDSPDEVDGASLESLVFQELRAVNQALELGYDISYWRTSHHVEVDFILYGEKGFKAVEVKRASRVRDEDFNGLNAFLQDYPMSDAFLLYGGHRKYSHGKIQVIPVAEFLENLPAFLDSC